MLKRLLVFLILGIGIVDPCARTWDVEESLADGVKLVGLTEQQKKEMFLKAREDLFPISPSPPTSQPSPAQKKNEKSSASEKASTTHKGSSHRTKKSSEEGHKRKESTEKEETVKRRETTERASREKSSQKSDERERSQIRIVKSGYQEDEGLIPAGDRGGKRRYRYLTPAVRRAIDRAPVKRGRWKYVIVHNSGTRQGNARIFDLYHRRVRHMQNGLAYHFVIGNGRSSGNGQIEIGERWRRQINGGHVASDYLNNIALGICLVGDYNRDVPTPQQLAALEELISYLRGRVGRFKGRLAIVLGHREINPKPTDCPGKKFPLRWLHRKFPPR